jgi:hypothetical protein
LSPALPFCHDSILAKTYKYCRPLIIRHRMPVPIYFSFWGFVMSDTIWFRTGEATVFSSEGQGTDAMPEILIGNVKGPAGNAFATLMGQTEGHTRMFAIRACNQQVRPATLMVPKVTIKSTAYVNLFGGPMPFLTASLQA